MKVYLVVESDYDGSTVIGVFELKDKAYKLVSKMELENQAHHSALGWNVEEWETT